MRADAAHGLLPTLGDYAAEAARRLDPAVRAYYEGGAGDEHTLADNVAAWQRIGLQQRVLRALAGGHTRCRLLGREHAHPLLVAPMARQRLLHPEGELAMAWAASALQAGLVLSTQTSVPLDPVAAAFLAEPERLANGRPGRGPLWFQLYLLHDRGHTLELVQRVEVAGYEALVLTVDAPVQGPRDRERRAGFRVPADVPAVELRGMAPRPDAVRGEGDSALFDGLLRHAPTWEDVAWLRSRTRLPLLLKGITHPEDAREAVRAGAAGLIVSNHGGRLLDTAPATAELLPRVVDAVGAHTEVLVDGGIRRGTDVLKALALGARAVLVGRPAAWGLAVAGAQGVAHVLRLLRDELEIAMALTGCRTLDGIGPAQLWPPRDPA